MQTVINFALSELQGVFSSASRRLTDILVHDMNWMQFPGFIATNKVGLNDAVDSKGCLPAQVI